MIDIETLSTTPNALILTIGAIIFTVVFYKMGHLILHILSCVKSLVYRYTNIIV